MEFRTNRVVKMFSRNNDDKKCENQNKTNKIEDRRKNCPKIKTEEFKLIKCDGSQEKRE